MINTSKTAENNIDNIIQTRSFYYVIKVSDDILIENLSFKLLILIENRVSIFPKHIGFNKNYF